MFNRIPLRERVASTFENGYGDEGILAKGIYWLMMLLLIVFGFCMAPIILIAELAGRIRSRFIEIRDAFRYRR